MKGSAFAQSCVLLIGKFWNWLSISPLPQIGTDSFGQQSQQYPIVQRWIRLYSIFKKLKLPSQYFFYITHSVHYDLLILNTKFNYYQENEKKKQLSSTTTKLIYILLKFLCWYVYIFPTSPLRGRYDKRSTFKRNLLDQG